MSKVSSCKIDWLSFSDKFHDISELYSEWQQYFGEFVSFGGRYGYRDRFSANGCDLLFNPPATVHAMGCMVDINGTGTNLLYEQGFKLEDYIRSVLCNYGYYNVSRLDVCLDFFADCEEDMFPFDKLIERVNTLNFVSKVHKCGRSIHIDSAPSAFNTPGSQPTATVYIGSPKSETRLRIYNKLGEQFAKSRGDKPVVPDVFDGKEVKQWIRFEFQLRHVSAISFCGILIDHDLHDVFISLLNRYVRFVEHMNYANVSENPVCDWWSNFLGDIPKIII